MAKQIRQKHAEIFGFADLNKYTLRERFLIRAADLVLYLLIRLLGKTIRLVEDESDDRLREIERRGHVPVYAFWHNRIFLATYFFRHRGIVVMTSRSFDGEYIARFIQRFGYGAVRGSSTRGGAGALAKMIRLVNAGRPAAFTVDGPRGPRYEAKRGPCLLAKKTGQPIVPISFAAESYWTIGSWDRLQIPKPFTRARILTAAPIYVGPEATAAEIADKRAELQSKLDELTEVGEQWRHGRKNRK